MTTKEKITEEALTLFAEKGYKGTSVKNIADAVGIKDASLYNHFKSKQEIFDSIVELISKHISELSITLGVPQYDKPEATVSDFFTRLDLAGLKKITRESFVFYLTDPYISRFWRIAQMEQYVNPQIYTMFRKIFMEDAISYQEKLFKELMKQGVFYPGDARATAISFYSPIYLLLSMYSNQPERKEEALEVLDRQIEEFFRIYRKKD
ncbi:MAG: TetR/AcrR family transcriptional regulator [Blautia sp.]|nr:TetR/AcrR family transcriptional regulator [Blautia sp.]